MTTNRYLCNHNPPNHLIEKQPKRPRMSQNSWYCDLLGDLSTWPAVKLLFSLSTARESFPYSTNRTGRCPLLCGRLMNTNNPNSPALSHPLQLTSTTSHYLFVPNTLILPKSRFPIPLRCLIPPTYSRSLPPAYHFARKCLTLSSAWFRTVS